ncbi:MAG: AsmA family protein, partial [Candidatus Omnitrophica bacterium]|nr:AsmA family protein [Candidatus Omnitrophota bacterium]
NLKFKFDLASADARILVRILPALAQARIQNPLAGQVEFSADEAHVSAKGFSMGKLNGQISGGEINTAYLISSLKDIEGKFSIIGRDLNVPEISCALGSGRINLSASINDYLGAQGYKANLKVADLNIKEVLNQTRQDVILEGIVSFEAALEGQGLSSLSEIQPKSGTASLRLKQGKLVNINVLRIVLDKMSMLPDLVARLEANLPQRYRASLAQNDTELKAVNFDMNVSQGVFNINSGEIDTDVFSVNGNGTLDLHLNTQMQAKISIPKDLSDSMAQAVQELKYLFDREGRITIPLTIEGKIPDKLAYLPDLEYLGRQFLENQGRSEINKLLNKALHRKGDDAGGADSSSDNSGTTEIINNVLDKIFKK